MTIVQSDLVTTFSLVLITCGALLHAIRLPSSPFAARARFAIPFNVVGVAFLVAMAIWQHQTDLEYPDPYRSQGALLAFDIICMPFAASYFAIEALLSLRQRLRVSRR